MKTIQAVFSLLIVFLLSMSASAQPFAGVLTYTPDAAGVTIPAGSQGMVTTYIDVTNTHLTTYYLRPVSTVTGGNLPVQWITAAPFMSFLIPGTPAAVTLTITVPQGTSSGLYSGHLVSDARAAHGIADPGKGLLVTVTVPPDCSGVAEIHLASEEPIYLWPPDHSMEQIAISGEVNLPRGCTLLEAGYSIDDEYGVYTSVGALQMSDDKNFTLTVPVEAWREGKDKDGRHYRIRLFARDEAGIGSSSPVTVIVPHDQRK